MGRRRNNNKKCSVTNCNKKHYAKTFCKKHYDRWKKYKDPLMVKNVICMDWPDICTIENCKGYHEARGYCGKHYQKLRKYGDPLYIHPKFRHKTCSVDGCNNKVKCHDLCNHHFYKNNTELYLEYNKKSLKKLCIRINYDNIRNWSVPDLVYALSSWSKAVKKRDDYTCQICGSKKNLHAHHILYKRFYPKLCLNINNGITLCKDCHWEIHRLTLKKW